MNKDNINLSAVEKVKLIKNGKLSAVDNIHGFLDEIDANNAKGNKINAILELNNDALLQAKEVDSKLKSGKTVGRLVGLAIAVKSNINVFGLKACCASKTLENYKSGFNATVIEKIRAEDGIIIGMANCDEFASGSSGQNSAFGFTKNPNALDRIPGGSCSGSAAAVAAGFCDLALGSDTGGSIRNPASHCGIVGLKPSYGAVSRYGLIDLAMSFDTIGPLAKNVEDAQLVFDVIHGEDEKEATTQKIKEAKKLDDKKKIVIGVVKVSADPRILEQTEQKIRRVVKEQDWVEKEIEIKHLDLGIQTYYPIVYVEFASGTRKLDGRRYGSKIEDSCGEEALRRILGGQMISQEEFSGRYYKKALDAKKILTNEVIKAFEKVDIIAMPVVPKLPHKFGEKISAEDEYDYDTLTVVANLTGIPGISVPNGKIDNLPVGIQLFAAVGEDFKLLEVAEKFEEEA
jgi:aspartyl-tRNA(Asn)/glutamyl-tRNA(Gln) amidotransferase subunit A